MWLKFCQLLALALAIAPWVFMAYTTSGNHSTARREFAAVCVMLFFVPPMIVGLVYKITGG